MGALILPPGSVAKTTDDAIAEARVIIEEVEQGLGSSRFDHVSRQVIGIVVIGVWAAAVLGYGFWTLAYAPDFVCSLPGDATKADYTGVCENGWSAAIENSKDLLATFVLPVVTLVLGYYFGKWATASQEEV